MGSKLQCTSKVEGQVLALANTKSKINQQGLLRSLHDPKGGYKGDFYTLLFISLRESNKLPSILIWRSKPSMLNTAGDEESAGQQAVSWMLTFAPTDCSQLRRDVKLLLVADG